MKPSAVKGDTLRGTGAQRHIRRFTACVVEHPDMLKTTLPCGKIGADQHTHLPRVAFRAQGPFDFDILQTK